MLKLSDEFLWNWFEMPDPKEQENYSYAITPYIDKAEYLRDKQLMVDHNSSVNPQSKFLMIMAAKVERTDISILNN